MKLRNFLFKIFIAFTLGTFLIIFLSLFVNLFLNGKGFWDPKFLLGSPEGLPPGREGGIFPAIVGTFITFLLSSVISAFLAIMTAIYVRFYVKSAKVEKIFTIIIQCISGVPSIVLGLFGYTLLVYKMGLGKSVLSASITLAIMIFPFIEVRIDKLIQNFDTEKIEIGLSLGLDKGFVIRNIVLKGIKREIIQTITLGGSLAMGATAPIMLTGAVIHAGVPNSLSSSFMSLPYHVYMLINEGISTEMGYKTAAVLIIILILINVLSMIFGRKDTKWSQRKIWAYPMVRVIL